MISDDDEMSGVFRVTLTTAEGTVVEGAGDQDYADHWLDEFRLTDTLVEVQRHELTEDELNAYGTSHDSPDCDLQGLMALNFRRKMADGYEPDRLQIIRIGPQGAGRSGI